MIVPYPAGGTTDFLGRLIAGQFRTGLGATVIVENLPGAATAHGAAQVAKSAPDGYTLMMATSTTLAINKTVYKKLRYDPVKDFAPVALVAAVPFALIVHPSIPATTLSDFVAYAKSRLANGSAGIGSPQHLAAEALSSAAGLDIHHVPYRGSEPALLDVVAGHIPFMVVDLQPALPSIRQGKVRALGVTAQKRVAAAPDIPTLAESGFPIRVGRVAGCCCAGGHATRDHRRIGKTDRKAPRRSRDEQAVRGNGDRTDRRIDAGRFRRLYQERNRPVGSDCRKVADKTGMTSRVVSSAQGALSWVGPGPPG